jgi:hypothetical protein
MTTPFRFEGLTQYLSNMASLIHLCRDRVKDSARTPLHLTHLVSWAMSMG